MSIASEISRISNNVQNTIDTIEAAGVTVPEGANSDNLPSLAQALANTKQDKLTGVEGQVVGFDSQGNAIAQDVPSGLPPGGTTGQVLTKTADGAEWGDPAGGLTIGSTPIEMPLSSTWVSMAYGNGRFVAVSQEGEIAYSSDRVTWQETYIGIQFSSVAFGAGVFVAVSDIDGTRNAPMYSTDGESWESGIGISGSLWNVCYGGSRFVAVGYSYAAYSEDGKKWTPASTHPEGLDGFTGVCYGNGKFVAVERQIISISEDGDVWETALQGGGNDYFAKLAFGNGVFSVVGSDLCLYSADGASWKAGSDAPQGFCNSIAFGGGRFVAIDASTGDVYISTNGSSYQAASNGVGITVGGALVYANGAFWAAANGGSQLRISPDGDTWSNSVPILTLNGQNVTAQVKLALNFA